MIANPNDGNSPRVEVATPTIDVSTGGLITATTEQGKGYVAGGSKSATQQLPTQGAATIMPGTTDQIAVASGRYTTGDVKVAGDANLVPENIAEGASIFGVTGTHSGGGAMAHVVLNGAYTTAPGSTRETSISYIDQIGQYKNELYNSTSELDIPLGIIVVRTAGTSTKLSIAGSAQSICHTLYSYPAGYDYGGECIYIYGDCEITDNS